MEWTEDQKKFVKASMKRLARSSPQHLCYLLKRHMNVSVLAEDMSILMKELEPNVPPLALAPLTLPRKGRDLRGACIDLINEAKTVLAKEGVHRVEKNAEKTKNGITPLLCLSDLHFGEIIEINGQKVFDLEEAKNGLTSIVQQFIEARELDGYEVDGCAVLLAGDIIDGELIYPAQSFDTEGNVFTQMKEATIAIWNSLIELSHSFSVVKVYCVPGNHGRSSKLHHQMANWDNALYFSLQLMANVRASNIEIHTPTQMWMDFDVRGWRIHTRHIGVVQASSAGPVRKVMTWMDNHDADLFFFGHYHSPEMYSLGRKRIFKNGALPPSNDFAENLGFQDGVGQWMIGVTDSDPVAFAKILSPD